MAILTLPRPARIDARLLGLIGLLAIALASGVVLNWWVALGVVGVGAILTLRPFEPFHALVAVAGVATFVNGSGGHLTRELSVVTVVLGYSAVCVLLAYARGLWSLPRAPLTTVILVFEGLTIAAAVHGLMAGYEMRYLGLELLPLLGLLIALMAGGLRLGAADLRFAQWVFVLVSTGHVILGFLSYAINHVRTGGLWFTPIPGLVSLLLFNLALREPRRKVRMLLILFMSANLLHQLISLTRGYWMGLAAGFAVSCFFYGGRGPGARARWRQVFAIFGWLALLLGIGAVVTSSVFGWGDTAAIFGSRLVSSVGTEHNTESSSNFERILEWIASARKIAEAPWMGHGLGLTLHVRHPIYQVTSTQWYIHQLYLWIWLKEGLIGLISLVAVLVVAIRTGLWSARRLPPPEAAWGAAAAAATAYTAALGFTNYPMAMVNSTYIMVLMWGIALSLGGPAHWHFTWRARPAVADDRSASSP